jgi:hydrogenase/urease accessory protein HupE
MRITDSIAQRRRRPGCVAWLAAAALATSPAVADAHLVSTGFGPFYDGVSHLAMSPGDLLGVLALALLGGLGGTRHGRLVLLALPLAWLLGGWIGLQQSAEVTLPAASAASFLVAGALVAADRRLPPAVVAAFAGALGGVRDRRSDRRPGRVAAPAVGANRGPRRRLLDRRHRHSDARLDLPTRRLIGTARTPT